MSRKSIVQLKVVTVELARSGYDVAELRAVERELRTLGRPPGFFGRLSSSVIHTATLQWRHLVGELQESREAFGLLRGALSGRRLSAEERDAVRSQLFDLVRIFPAGLIAAANSAFPIPGTGLLTPWILRKMGLLPSRWREAHVLAQLKLQVERLESAGNHAAAAKLRAIEHQVEADADERERVARDAALLTHWDENQNGAWDPEERAKYEAEAVRLRGLLPQLAPKKSWFVSYEGEVFGPVRLSELSKKEEPRASLLCCHDGKSGWIAIGDLLDLGEPAVPLLQAVELPATQAPLPESRRSRGPLDLEKARSPTKAMPPSTPQLEVDALPVLSMRGT